MDLENSVYLGRGNNPKALLYQEANMHDKKIFSLLERTTLLYDASNNTYVNDGVIVELITALFR